MSGRPRSTARSSWSWSTTAHTDGTREFLDQHDQKRDDLRVVLQDRNWGKGAAIRPGIEHVTGEITIIQDADLEYDPRDYPALLRPILEGRADIVFGNRFDGGEHRVLYYRHFIANRFLTTICNVLTDLNLSDMEVGYKCFALRCSSGSACAPTALSPTPKAKRSTGDGVVALWRMLVLRFVG